MGLLKRFRASSSASARPDVDTNPPPLRPPPILTHSQLYASISRASILEPSTAVNGMETPKSSKSFWKRKAKANNKEVMGLPYESTSPSPAQTSSRTSSFVHVSTERRDHQHRPQEEYRRDREGSSTPKQETTPRGPGREQSRAMLGKLDFEGEHARALNNGHRAQASAQPARMSAVPFGMSSQQPGVGRRPQTAIHMPQADRRPSNQPRQVIAEQPGRISQDEMEHLTSPEKHDVSTPDARRMSRISVQEDPGSPTPRKGSLPPQELTSARPQTFRAASSDDHAMSSQRRPSASRRNSFIPLGNPFSRSSRVSINDLEAPIDDGSFQLRSFRHVSGASQADHDLDPYHKQSRSDAIETSPVNTTASIPATGPEPITRSTSAAPLSRPMSRAASLASLDDHISSSAKVSAAAFRKGIRRPSSTFLGDGMDDDDDDDVPLGMLRTGRHSSAVSLSSMKDGARTPGHMHKSPAKSSTRLAQSATTSPTRPRPSLPSSPIRQSNKMGHTRSKTTPLISPDEIHPIFDSPTHSPTASPKAAQPPLPADGYFASAGPRANDPETPPVVNETLATQSPEFDFSTLGYPVSAFSTSPLASKIAPPTTTTERISTTGLQVSDLKPSGLAVTIPSPAGGSSTMSSAISPAMFKVEQRQDTLDEDLIIRSMALYSDSTKTIDIENEPPTSRTAAHQQSHSTLFGNDSISSDANSTIRSPLSERLGNLVGPRPMTSKSSLPKLDTLRLDENDMERVKSPASDVTVSPTGAMRDVETPTSRSAPVTSTPQSSASESESESEEEVRVRPVNPPRSSFANAPRPRPAFQSSFSQSSLSRVAQSGAESDDDSDEDIPLARIKSKASRSSLAPKPSSSNMRPATIHSESPKPVKTVSPTLMPPSSYIRRASVPDAVGASAPQISDHSFGQKLWDASPASSQSGLTGDSSAGQPITPSDREMGDGKVSRDGSFPPAAMYLNGSSIPGQIQERPASVMSSTGYMDDATRQRMKEVWQAQYMAAASKAFEEEWERQSSIAGSVAPSVQSYSPYASTPPHHHQPTPQQQPYQMPPMGMGYNYPPQFQMYPPPQQMQWPPAQQSMYAYGPGAQSVYGGEFGPPAMPMSPYRPMSMMGFPQSYSSSNLSQYSPQPQPQAHGSPASRNSYFPPAQQPYHEQGHRHRSTSSRDFHYDQNQNQQDQDLTPPKKGLIHQIPSGSPKGVSNRRSQLGISVINANDRERERPVQPPTSWRRSTAVPLIDRDRDEQAAPRRKRQSSYLVN